MEIKKVGIVGAGALGILIGKNLADTLGKANVTFIADEERCRKYEQQGFISNGETCDFSYASTPVNGTLDLIIFAVKIYNLRATLPLVKPFVDDHTVLMSIMNGISSEEIIGEALGANQVIYTVGLDMDATKQGNELTFTRPGMYRMGEANGEVSERLSAVADLFDRASIKYELKANIKEDLWSKLMLNTGVNQTLAVLGGSYRTIHEDVDNARTIMRDAMEEVRSLAKFEGVVISEEDVTDWFTIIDGLGADKKPSMLQDIEAGRETEVELFAGTVKKLGEKHQMPTPVNDWLYDEIKRKTDRAKSIK